MNNQIMRLARGVMWGSVGPAPLARLGRSAIKSDCNAIRPMPPPAFRNMLRRLILKVALIEMGE